MFPMAKFDVGSRALSGERLVGFAAMALPIVFGLMHATQIGAQSQPAEATPDIPKFEVATIKPTQSDENGTMRRRMPDGIAMTGVPVQMLLTEGFGMEDDRIIGAPGWAKSDRFDIQGKVSEEDAPKLKRLTPDQRGIMLQTLLEDRFKLKFHHETRELPVYALVIENGGSKLKGSKPDDPTLNGGHGLHMMSMGSGDFEAQGASIGMLIQALSLQVRRTIVDETGLAGNYDFRLKWVPDDAPPVMAGAGSAGAPGNEGATPPDAVGPSLFTALEEQLGLKLEPQKGPIDVIIIDHIEKPSEN